jgi:Winged helix-turn helix
MRAGIVVNVTPEDRHRLAAIVADRSSAQKHVWRTQIILATADGCGTVEVMRRSGKAKPVIWRWQERFMQEGVDGLLRDKTRPPGKPPLLGGDGAARPRFGARAAARNGRTSIAPKPFRLHKVVNEPDFLPLFFIRHVARFAKLVRPHRGSLRTTGLGKDILAGERHCALRAILFPVTFWHVDLGYFGRGVHGSWPQRDIGILLWSLSVAAADWMPAASACASMFSTWR